MKSKQIRCLRNVLEEFERQNVGYCVLRNYEFLYDERFEVESLDTVVALRDYHNVERILLQAGFMPRKQQFSLKHKAFFKLLDEEMVSFDIQVGGVYWNDMLYLGEEIVEQRVRKEFFFVPSNNHTFVMLLVHSVLGKRYFKSKYQHILASLSYDKEYVWKKLSEVFSPTIARTLINSAVRGSLPLVSTKYLVLRFLFSKPKRLGIIIPLFFRWLRWKKFFKAYPLIVFIGPDGAGKSTQVQSLGQFLQKKRRRVAIVYMGRGRGQILPFGALGRAYKRAEKKRDAARHKGISIKKRIVYTLSAPIFTLDLLLRYVVSIFLPRRRRTIVITDRYCSDIYLMKYVPWWFKKRLFSLFPKPTLVFYLYNESCMLHERRPEEPVEELERQMRLLGKISQTMNAIMIKTDDKEKVRKEIMQRVFEYVLKEWY